MTVDMCKKAGVNMGQAIDPSIFTDEDGTSYLLFGNGSAAIAQLNDDMMSIKEGTLKQINGLTDFRESVVVTKVDGKYHWTWSCDDANSPNYHVNYGVSDTLTNEDGSASVNLVKKNLLSKDESKGILGSAHQSVLHVKDADGNDRYFMAYHRFYTPINIFTSGDGLGVHRETCVDEITFDENGYMLITPTLEGVGAVKMKDEGSTEEPDDGNNDNGGNGQGDGNTDNGGNGHGDGNTNNDGNSQNAGNAGQTGGDDSAAGTVKTGDSANIMLWTLLLGASVLGCFAVVRKRKV